MITTIIEISVGKTMKIVPSNVKVDFKSSYENPKTNKMTPTINKTHEDVTEHI